MRGRIETLALLATAILVRALFPEASFFGPDQVGILIEGRAVLEGALFPPGPGVGWTPLKLGPLFEWVTAIGLVPRDHFADVIVLLAIIHGISVLGWRHLFAEIAGVADARQARLTGWALALHPLAISSGSAPISTAIVMPTTLLFTWGCVRWFQQRRASGFALACVGAALMIQAHITTVFLLPLLAFGFWRRAPIGRIGLVGLALGVLIASPMVVPNLLVSSRENLRHAGTAGGPFAVAVGRAAALEMRVLELAGSVPAPWRPPAQLAALAWSALMLAGAVIVIGRPMGPAARPLLACGLVIPTLCIALIPRGALLLYLDATLPFRAWLFATGVCALAAAAPGRAPVMALRLAALAALVAPATFVVANRLQIAAHGYSRVNMSRLDLREPADRPPEPVGVLTLGSLKALGRALDELGADPESIQQTWHGPWRWAGAQSVGVFVEDSRRQRTVETPHAGDPHAPDGPVGAGGGRAFLVLHEDDRSAAPASAPVRAGPFRVYPFDNRLRVVAQDDGRLTAAIEPHTPDRTTLQLVTDSGRGITQLWLGDVPLEARAIPSSSGFLVWSASLPGEAAPLHADLGAGEAPALQVRAAPDAYAFTAPPTEP